MELTQEGAVIPEWTLGDRLRKARQHAGLEQAQLATEIGISRSSIVTYETGRTEPSRPVLVSWAICTNCDLGWLLGQGRINVRYLARQALQASDRLGLAA